MNSIDPILATSKTYVKLKEEERAFCQYCKSRIEKKCKKNGKYVARKFYCEEYELSK